MQLVTEIVFDSDGNRTDYDYDPTGRLTGIWASNNDYTAFAYDDAGRLIEKWFPNGVNTQYTYNRDNTLKQLVNRHGAGLTSASTTTPMTAWAIGSATPS